VLRNNVYFIAKTIYQGMLEVLFQVMDVAFISERFHARV